MDFTFEDKLCSCIENLKIENYRSATADLYPISKQTPRLGNASNGVVCKFAGQMINVLEVLGEKIGDEGKSFEDMEKARHFLMDIYRVLRNSCATNQQVQDELGGIMGSKVMESTRIILDAARRHFRGESLVQCMAVGIQFLSNLASGCQKNQDLVWDHFCAYLKSWLDMAKGEPEMDQERTMKILNYTCAIVDACLPRQWEREEKFLDYPQNRAVIISTVQANTTFLSMDFGKKAMAKVVQIPNFLQKLIGDLNYIERACVFCSMQEVIDEWRNADEGGTAPTIHSNLLFLVEFLVSERTHLKVDLLRTPEASMNVELHQHVRMLEVLSQASSCSTFTPVLTGYVAQKQEEPRNLLMYALGLLWDVQKAGQEGNNMLSMTRDTRTVNPSHPSFMLRRDLLRLIGNLCYQNKAAQDQVREAYGQVGIPLLFGHTMVDERNPFQSEWAKLALTNVVRDSEENAKYIKNLKLQGHVDPTGILRDCGLVLESKGDKVVVRSEGSVMSLSKLSEKAPCRP